MISCSHWGIFPLTEGILRTRFPALTTYLAVDGFKNPRIGLVTLKNLHIHRQ